eukprot:8773643-Alexandrium_andersonii.AAC.1
MPAACPSGFKEEEEEEEGEEKGKRGMAMKGKRKAPTKVAAKAKAEAGPGAKKAKRTIDLAIIPTELHPPAAISSRSSFSMQGSLYEMCGDGVHVS